ncbi:MAG: hypothetical protein SGILL_005829 [Bacillariaceae sp.]
MDALFLPDESPSGTMIPISLVGQTTLRLESNRTSLLTSSKTSMLVLTAGRQDGANEASSANAMLVPLTAPNPQLRLLSFAYAKRPLASLTLLLSLNALLVNRDNGLFDNLPWATWSKDPQRRNRDAAGNPIEVKFHLGKRDAYNRFMGKDWPGRSLALGNLALRLKYLTEIKKKDVDGEPISSETDDDSESRVSLAQRILQLRIRELQMELAELDSKLSIAENNPESYTMQDLNGMDTQRFELDQELESAKADLGVVSSGVDAKDRSDLSSEEAVEIDLSTDSIVNRIARWSVTSMDGKNRNNKAPYRGAMGYAPMLDSQKNVEKTFLDSSYRSPYDLLKEILRDQLNAEVIGCALENTSLLRGNVVMGGAILIQRNTPTKSTRLAGEDVKYQDFEEDFGNEGIVGGETMVVECDADEAVGVALAYGLPLRVEQAIFENAPVLVNRDTEDIMRNATNMKEVLPVWKVQDSALTIQVEGDADMADSSSPISIPRTTASLFDSMLSSSDSNGSSSSTSSTMFPTDNPIKSLQQLDGLNNASKAKTLLEMSNFSERLPRPRVLRTSPPNDNPLDKLLLPLIDESVRNQYQIRQAEQKGDTALVEQLRSSQSKLQEAREKADTARTDGNEELAEKWDNEARFLESLRADVTQNEGSYSRFLDRDDWYERDRQRTANRAKKSSFGNLMDGIE